MRRRLAGWCALDGRQKGQLLGCLIGMGVVHASLAVLGYKRTRGLVERCTLHASPRPASGMEIADARALAHLASIASHHGMVGATCLRRSLLLYGWLRIRGLQPVLQLGVPRSPTDGAFRAHAWVELEGDVLLPGDTGYRPFIP